MDTFRQRIPGSNTFIANYRLRPRKLQLLVGKVARLGLIFCIVVIYSGIAQFLFIVSTIMLYAFYLMMLTFTALYIVTDRRSAWGIRSVVAYLYWFSLYALWGLLIAPLSNLALPEVLRMVFRNYLIIVAVVVGLSNLRGLAIFNYLVQLAVFINFAIGIWQYFDPQLTETLAYARDSSADAFNVLRPAGLWVNPDEAAFAFLFAFLISFKGRGVFFVIARIAAIGGIYLSASRTGSYILALYALIALLFALKYVRPNRGRVVASVCGGALLLIILPIVILSLDLGSLELDLSKSLIFARMLDVSEEEYGSSYSRADVTAATLEAVIQAPIQGYGVFTIQQPNLYLPPQLINSVFDHLDNGAHNIYLVVWGEIGIIGLLAYLLVLWVGFYGAIRTKLRPGDRLIAILLWLTYLIIGLTWHIEFTYMLGITFVPLIYHFHRLVERSYAVNELDTVFVPNYMRH